MAPNLFGETPAKRQRISCLKNMNQTFFPHLVKLFSRFKPGAITFSRSDEFILLLCNNVDTAYQADSLIRSVDLNQKVEVWAGAPDDMGALHYTSILPTSSSDESMIVLTAPEIRVSSLQEAQELAARGDLEIEVTLMQNNTTLFCNCLNIEQVEGVLQNPLDRVGFDSRFFWRGFEEDLEELERRLRQDGQALSFVFRNQRLDRRGYNEFVKDYFLFHIPLMGDARVSITRDWRQVLN